MKKAFLGIALLAALAAAGEAAAGPRIVFGLHFGVPLYGHPYHYYYPPYYYPPPVYYYPPPPSVIYAPPPTIESAPAPTVSDSSWFYCAESRGYYPYVRECPGGWERVPPSPPPGR